MSGSEPRRGAYFERQVQADLRANGYWTMKSPASRGAVDLVAIKPGQVLFVQCKLGGYLEPGGWNALWEECAGAGAVPVLAARQRRGMVAYWRLRWPKTRPGLRQPLESFVLDEAANGEAPGAVIEVEAMT